MLKNWNAAVVQRFSKCAPRTPPYGVPLGGLQGQSCLHNEIYMPLAYFTVLVFAWMVSKNWIYLTEAGILNSCPSKS